jgi:hypothetical protein
VKIARMTRRRSGNIDLRHLIQINQAEFIVSGQEGGNRKGTSQPLKSILHARHPRVGSDIVKVHLIEGPDPNRMMTL